MEADEEEDTLHGIVVVESNDTRQELEFAKA